jgi:predicted regulator of Ras-like GTPase activity (Roadblock/LC7/MglB family)
MAFSLSGWFKGKPEDGTSSTEVETGATPPAAPEPPAGEGPRPRVTVRAVRTVTPHSAQPATLRAPSARQAIPLPGAPPELAEAGARGMPGGSSSRRISFGTSADPLAVPLNEPPRMETAPAPPLVPPGPDVKVVLEVGDFVDRLPSSFLQSGPLDRQRKVEFRSSELYSDLARGRASVPASIIYKKCPDIFSRPVTAVEDIEVALPLQKLVEQMSGAFQTRRDQVAVENVGEIETPFLHVALEDNARLPKAAGTSAGPIAAPVLPSSPAEPSVRENHRTGSISTITPAKGVVEAGPSPAPSNGQSQALKRPPSTVRASVAGAKIRVSSSAPVRPRIGTVDAPMPPFAPADPHDPGAASRAAGAAASPSHQVAKKTARIQIPPISLRPPGTPAKPGFSAPPAAPAVPMQSSPVGVRQAPGADAPPTFRSMPGMDKGGAATFRSTPPPPAVKPPPPSFSPRRTNLMDAPSAGASPLPSSAADGPGSGDSEAVPPVPVVSPAAVDDRRIALKLAAILRGLPSTALTVDPESVPADVQISLPFALIEPQLGSGRVAVPGAAFRDALPSEYRNILADDGYLTEIPLPLPEVFSNLPSDALSLRADQVVEETGATYLTPFSQKAEEDAARFSSAQPSSLAASASAPAGPAEEEPAIGLALAIDPAPAMDPAPPHAMPEPARAEFAPEPPTAPVEAKAEPPDLPAPIKAEAELPKLPEPMPESAVSATPTALVPAPPEPAAEPSTVFAAPVPPPAAGQAPAISFQAPVPPAQPETVLQALFMTEDELDAKTVVKLVSQLPGIDGCAVMFGDGLRLAGNFPESARAEGFSAMSPPFYKRTMNFASELKLGELQAFTIYTNTGLLSFFMHADICMSVRHAGRGFLPGVREKLETVTRELAQMYSSAPAPGIS